MTPLITAGTRPAAGSGIGYRWSSVTSTPGASTTSSGGDVRSEQVVLAGGSQPERVPPGEPALVVAGDRQLLVACGPERHRPLGAEHRAGRTLGQVGGEEVDTGGAPRHLDPEEAGDGGEHVGRLRAVVRHLPSGLARPFDEQRHRRHLADVVVGDHPPVHPGADGDAVVGGDHQQRVVVAARRLEAVDEVGDEPVDVLHLEEMSLVGLLDDPGVVGPHRPLTRRHPGGGVAAPVGEDVPRAVRQQDVGEMQLAVGQAAGRSRRGRR